MNNVNTFLKNSLKFLKRNDRMLLIGFLLTILIALVIRSSFSGKNFRDNFQLLPVSSLNNAANSSDFIEKATKCPTAIS